MPANRMGWMTARKMSVDSSCMMEFPNSLIDMESRKSTSSVSLENRLRILPTGVTSKNSTGARTSPPRVFQWITLDACSADRRFIRERMDVRKTNPNANPRYPPT